MASEFWDKIRHVAKAVSSEIGQTFNGRGTPRAIRHATPLERASALVLPGQPISNKWEELGHDTSWNYVGIHTVAKMWALASATLFDESKQVNKRLMGLITKGTAQDSPDEKRTPIDDHEILDLLEQPNPCMTRMQFMYILGTHLRLTGGWAILEIRSLETQKPIELYPIPRAWMTLLPQTEQYPLGEWQVMNPRGMVGYGKLNPLAGGFRVDAREMIVSGWPHPLYPGEQISPLTACGRIIDIMEQTDHTVWSSLLHAYHNGTILLMQDGAIPPNETQPDRMVQKFHDTKSGPGNAGKTAALYNVKSIEKTAVPLAELNAVEVRNQNKDFGLGIQGVPSVATGIRSEVGSYAGDAATFNAFAEWGIQPDLDLFAGCLNNRFKHYWPSVKLEFFAKRADDPQLVNQKRDQLFAGIEKQAVTVNEWRASMDLPPVEGGDEMQEPPAPPQMPGAMGADDQPGAMPGQDAASGDDADFDLGLDTEDEPGDEVSSGFKRPDLSKAGGRGFSRNGSH